MEELFSILVIMIEIICCIMFFKTFLKRNNENWKTIGILFVVMVTGFYVSCKAIELYNDYFMLKQICCILLMSVFSKIYFNEKFLKCLVLSMLFIGVLWVADALTYIIMIVLFSTPDMTSMNKIGTGNLIVLIGKMILFVFVLIVKKIFSKEKVGNLSNAQWIQLGVFPFFSILITCMMLRNYQLSGDVNQLPLMYILEIGLIVMSFLEFFLIYDVVKRENRIYEAEILEMQMAKQLEIYRVMEENNENQKKRIHDFNNKISCLAALAYDKKNDELIQYIEELNVETKNDSKMYNSNNAIIDAIINNKYKIMVDKKIMFITRIGNLKNLSLKNDDSVILLSNLLDNAIEASEKCENNRYIKLKMENEADTFFISVENSMCQQVVENNGVYETIKKDDKENHGYGVKNILTIVEKYSGDYCINYNDNSFLFSIFIPQ